MPSTVEQDEFDIQSPLQSSWAISFSILYLLVMVLSISLYLSLVRAIAKTSVHNVTYHLVFLLFFAALVEFAILLEEFMSRFDLFLFTTPNCGLFKFTVYGNRVLQTSTVLAILYFNLLAVYLKTSKCETIGLQIFPVIVLLLLLIELATTLPAALNVRVDSSHRMCELVDKSKRVGEGWWHGVLLPYWLPLVLASFPTVYLGVKLKLGSIVELRQSQVRVALAISGSYFLFHLLYFLLLTIRLAQTAGEDAEQWNILLGLSVWLIARPMFALVGLGWHLLTPAACCLLDQRMRREWPARLLLRAAREDVGIEEEDEIGELGKEVATSSNNNRDSLSMTEISPNFSAMMLENREFHNPVFPVH